MKYGKRQLQEAIEYWTLQLETKEVIERLIQLTESEDTGRMRAVAREVQDTVKTPEDVRKFIRRNDLDVLKKGDGFTKKVWEWLKKAVGKGIGFIRDHWKLVIIVIVMALLAVYGLGGFSPEQVRTALQGTRWIFAGAGKNSPSGYRQCTGTRSGGRSLQQPSWMERRNNGIFLKKIGNR